MADNITNQKTSKVNIFDPNEINANNSSTLGTLNTEDLNIYVELTAERKGRGTVISGGVMSTDDDKFNINLLGMNNKTKNFTTNWTNNTPTSPNEYEGFGIVEIKIITNSSLLPQVTIEFVDIHGLTFFNKHEDSPYKVLFDFPPPIFKLVVKGYYGKPLKYDLHLTKTNVKFNSDNGNYNITSEFVARTFAPLTDVLFKYAEIFPLMDDSYVSNTTDFSIPPKNTHELLIRIKRLYDEIGKIAKTSENNKGANNTRTQLDSLRVFFLMIQKLKENKILIDVKKSLKVFMSSKDNNGFETLTETTLKDYTTLLINDGEFIINVNRNERYLVSVKKGVLKNKKVKSLLEEYGQSLLNKANLLENFYFNENISNAIGDDVSGIEEKIYVDGSGVEIEYFTLDITNVIQKTFRRNNKLLDENRKYNENYKKEINKLPEETLSFTPTIYNIFKIFCDDIDKFFELLRNTVILSEKHHEKYRSEILNSGGINNKNDKILPFPLFYENDKGNNVKKIPNINIENNFPEVDLVNKFLQKNVDILKEEKTLNLKSLVDENNNNVWLPISPVDSNLYGENMKINDENSIVSTNLNSPYSGLLLKTTNEVESIDNLYNKLIERYYLLSQYVYNNKFNDSIKNEFIIKFYAEAEAVNIVNSYINEKTLNKLHSQSKENVENFIKKLKNLNSGLYNNNNITEIDIDDTISLKINKFDDNYIGSDFISLDLITEKDINNSTKDSDPIDIFLDKYNDKKFVDYLFLKKKKFNKGITQNNLIFLKEEFTYIDNDKKYKDNSSSYYYVFQYEILNDEYYSRRGIESTNYGVSIKNWMKMVTGSVKFNNDDKPNNNVDYFKYLIDNKKTGDDIKSKAILFLSMFSRILTPVQETNRETLKILKNSGIHEIPNSYIIYIGGLLNIDYNNDNINKNDTIYKNLLEYNEIYHEKDSEGEYVYYNLYNRELFNNTTFNKIDNDIISLNKFLCKNDKENYKKYFNDFINGNFGGDLSYSNFEISLNEVLNNIKSITVGNTLFEKKVNKIIIDLLTNSKMMKIFDKKVGLMVYNSLAYSDSNDIYSNNNQNGLPLKFQSLSERENVNNLKSVDNLFFTTFLSKLGTYVKDRLNFVIELDNEYLGTIKNNDIKTRIYYSFKNIADKWLINDNYKKFPSISGDLIDQFRFVDRAMNDIGGGSDKKGAILDIEQLLDLSNNFDMNMLTLFSSILSHNNFEFFPLQNFIDFSSKDGWVDNSFKIFSDTTISINNSPAFICMYIGSLSSILEDSTSLFKGDGIKDLSKMGGDFMSDNTIGNNVNAFKVAYGSQQQSMFIGVDIDSREYPETNESLQILSKLSGDESNASPTPVAQNLFNLYQNRSYSSTVSMLGNVMIQPTHYYQIENTPLFNGAYEILNVEHNIKPNHMLTKFTGIRVGMYPNPLIVDFSTSIGVSGSNTDYENVFDEEKSTKELYTINKPPKEAEYNAMYSYKINVT